MKNNDTNGNNPVVACLAPSHEYHSIRQDRLSQDARDLLAWAFREKLPANDISPLPMNAVELKICDNDSDCLLYGGDGFCRHGGSDSLEYMHHIKDEGWAIVFSHDCNGNADRGAKIISEIEK